jgi:hypothetical protein
MSLDEAQEMALDQGLDAFTNADEDAQTANLIKGTIALDAWLRGLWYGKKKTQAQALAWPRSYVKDEDCYLVSDSIVPLQVKQAVMQIMLLQIAGVDFIQKTVGADNSVQSQTVGPISVTYKNSAPSITYYPQIMALLTGLASIGTSPVNVTIGLTEHERRGLQGRDGWFDPFDYPEYFNLIKE